jgi:hypothetical protein
LIDTARLLELVRTPTRDLLTTRAAFEALKPLVLDLVSEYEKESGREGGSFGRGLLDAIGSEVLRQVNDRAELSDETKLRSCVVTVVDGSVLVDCRLEVKCLPS